MLGKKGKNVSEVPRTITTTSQGVIMGGWGWGEESDEGDVILYVLLRFQSSSTVSYSSSCLNVVDG